MAALNSYSKEKRAKIVQAIQNNDIASYKNLIGYDSMTQSEKLGGMVFYQDMINTLNKITNTHSDKTIESGNDDIKGVLGFVNKVANKTLNRY